MELRPLRKSTSPVLFQAIQGRSLTRCADDVILKSTRILCEGTVENDASDGPVFHGSLMMTIDMHQLRTQIGTSDLRTDQLVQYLRNSLLFRMKLLRLTRVETELRCAPSLPGELRTELEFKIEPDRLLIDIDIIAPLMTADTGLDRATEESPR